MANLANLIVRGLSRLGNVIASTVTADSFVGTATKTEFIVGTQSASTGTWTGVTQDSELYDGKEILFYLPYAGSGNATLNLTLGGPGGTTGAKNVYFQGTTRCTTHFPQYAVIRMTYHEAFSINGTTYEGWWTEPGRDRDSDTYWMVRNNAAVKASAAVTAGNVIVGTSSGYVKAASGATFDISYPILYAADAISANGTSTNTYTAYHTVNLATTKSSWTGTLYSEVYLVLSGISGKTATIDSTVFTTTQPTSANGKLYIPLGLMHTTTNCLFFPRGQIMKYANSAFSVYATVTDYAEQAALATKATGDESGNNIKATYAAGISIDGTTITLVNKNNTSIGSVTVQTEEAANNAVTQTISSTSNSDYRVLFSGTADDTTRTEGARKDTDFKYNPSTNTLTVANVSGNASTATKATQDASGNTITTYYEPKANVTSKGSGTQPIYFDSSGVAQNTTYTLNKTVPSDAVFTDANVTQTISSTTNANYRVLLSGTADDTTRAEGVRKDKDLTYNPSTNTLTVGTVSGSVTGHASLDLPLSGGEMSGNITWKDSTALPQFAGAPTYLLGIEAFESGGATKWANASSVSVGSAATAASATNATNDADGNPIKTTYVKASEKGANSGVAPLNSSGKIDTTYLPAYVDDVLEYSAKSNFPATGETGKIYVDTGTNLTYRWSGTAYVEISPSLALGTTSSTAYRGDYGNTAYAHATDSSRLTTAKSSAFYKVAVTNQGHVASVTSVGASDITGALGNTPVARATGDASGNGIEATYLTKAAGVTNVAWDTTNKKLTKTINGTTSDVVAASTIKTALSLAKGDVGLGNVDNKSAATLKSEIMTAANITSALAETAVPLATADASGNTISTYYEPKANVTSKGSATQPVYFDSSGVAQSTTHTLNATVPSGAVFTDTTYTFAGGTNKFTVTPSGGSAQTVNVTPSITNNVTGSGTSGYLAKFNGANTITSGPQLGSSTASYLRNDGTWSIPDERYPAYGVIGTEIPASTDLNTYKTAGTYYSADSTRTGTLTNCPHTGSGFKMYVEVGYGTTRIFQTIKANNIKDVYERYYNASSWSDWRRINSVYSATTTSIGSASAGTAISADDITAWDDGSVPSLSYTARTVGSASGWSAGTMTSASVSEGVLTITAGTAPSLTITSVACDDITAWSAGSVPTLTYTSRSIPNISVTSTTVATGITAS